MNIQAIMPDSARLDPEQLASRKDLTEVEKIGQLAQQFEAMLARQILAEARKTVIQSPLASESTTSGIYQDMVTSNLADGISRSGGLGVADNLRRELAKQLIAKPAPASTPEPGAKKI